MHGRTLLLSASGIFLVLLYVSVLPVLGNAGKEIQLVPVPDPLSGENPVYPVPAMDLPSVGVSFADPNFGTTVMRVTATDGIHGRHEYSRCDPLNRDGTMIILDPETLWNIYRTQSAPYNSIQDLVRTIQVSEPRWDRTNPAIVWGFDEFKIVTQNMNTGTVTTVKNFQTDPVVGPIIAANPVYRITCMDEGESSHDRRFWALILQGDDQVNYEPLFVFTWDRQLDAIPGVYTLQPGERDLDWVGMSWSGAWVLLGGFEGNVGNIVGLTMADRTFSAFHRLDYSTAHADVGKDAQGRDVVIMQNTRTDYIDLIPVDPATQPILTAGGSYEGTNRTALVRLFYDNQSPVGLQSGIHISCNYPGYAVVSTYIEPGLPAKNWLDRTIILVKLDPLDVKAWYLATLHNTTGAYWEETHATMSEDGSSIIWASNWGLNVGTEEVFCMRLTMPSGWDAKPVPTLTLTCILLLFGIVTILFITRRHARTPPFTNN